MDKSQARGYYFEEIVRRLMVKTKYINVRSEEIIGKGAKHQIDSVGTSLFVIPFVNPIRLIAEAKWFKDRDKVGLGTMRSFVSVVKDISESYHVPPTSMGKKKRPPLPKRYTDAGAFFSVSGFSSYAQDFAWAYGIYLVSFGMNTMLRPIIDRAKQLIDQDVTSKVTKGEVIGKAQDHFRNDNVLSRELNKIYSYLGILDGIYPLLITSDGKFEFSPDQPDNFEVVGSDTDRNATKEYRHEEEENIHFRFNFQGSNFEFTLPRSTGTYLIDEIKNTYKGEPFAYIDIPIKLEAEGRGFRRIFQLNLSKPYTKSIINELKK